MKPICTMNDKTATNYIEKILQHLGEPKRQGTEKTPDRFVKAMQFLTSGHSESAKTIIQSAIFEEDYHDMVIIKDIEFYSLCEHHLLPFYGKCHIGYIPNGKIVGLSKLPRVVNVFARRLQVQERLTKQISEAIQESLQPRGIGVVTHAHHFCMMMRGVEKQSSCTITSSMQGVFNNQETRQEFMSHIIKDRL